MQKYKYGTAASNKHRLPLPFVVFRAQGVVDHKYRHQCCGHNHQYEAEKQESKHVEYSVKP